MIGQRLSHYEIRDKLGAGGMGEVWRAHDTQLDRDVALKVLPGDRFADESARARLVREARMASRLNHPHICTVYEVGESDGHTYIAMELVEGQTLSALLAQGPPPAGEVVRIGLQIADAVAHAHEKGVVHRDLKSANVILTPEGRVKVLDFGLAKRMLSEAAEDAPTQTMASLTGPGVIVGTLAYMAPEQLRGQEADTRSDVWSLGVVLYEMASGRRPFHGPSSADLSSAILKEAPPPLPAAVPGELGAVIAHCLAKEPAQRYQQAGEVRAVLEAIESGRPAPWAGWRYELSRRRWLVATGAAASVAVATVVGSRGRLWGPQGAVWLAVLPFENLSGDPEQEYFADGMTDALITDLSKISTLRVISRTSVMRYKKGDKKPLPQIARELNVRSVLEGSVVREGSRVRVTAQLIEASTDRHIWAERYERELSSVLALQSEIARAVASGVSARLQPQDEARLAAARQVNPATYEAYLKGMFYLDKSTAADMKKGMEILRLAVEKDPADPLANAGLAMGYLATAHGAEARQDSLQRMKAAALRALELDGASPNALFSMAMAEGYFNWNWDAAFDYMQRALDAQPNLTLACVHRAWYHVLFGRMREAMADHVRARELDPLNSFAAAWFAELYRYERRYDEAVAEALRAIDFAPKSTLAHWILGGIYLDLRKYDDAIGEIGMSVQSSPRWRWALGPAYVAAGRTAEARKLLVELNQQAPDLWSAYWRVELHAALGEYGEAFRWLDYEPHHTWVPWVRVIPRPGLAGLRKDPRFPAMLRKWRLPPLPESV